MRKQYKFIKHSKTDRYIRITNKTMLNITAFNVAVYCILRNLVEIVLLLCFPNLLCLRSQIWKRYSFALFVRISAMQINGSGQIVTGVTSVWFNFFELHCAFDFLLLLGFTVVLALFVRMRLGYFASAEATTGFALWIPTTFEKVDETLSVFSLLLLFGSSGFVPCCRRGCYLWVRTEFGRV